MLIGGAGNDKLSGGQGHDAIRGGSGNDLCLIGGGALNKVKGCEGGKATRRG